MVDVERRLRGNVEQRARLESSLDVDAQMLERIVPVMADVLVELAVLLLGDLVLATSPDGLHRVERLVLQTNGIRDEIRVALDDVLEDPLRSAVLEPVLLVLRLEVKGHRRSGGGTIRRRERVSKIGRAHV